MHVRLRNNFDQRRTSAVEVDQRVPVVVRQLASILFHVRVMNPHPFERAVFQRRVDIASQNDRLVHLRCLVALWQVRIEIMLAIKPANAGNRRIQRLTSTHRQLDGVLIQHWQHARQAKINLVRFFVWLSVASVVISRTKQLGFGRQLDMALDANGHFIFIIYTHHNAPKSFNACSNAAIARLNVWVVIVTRLSWAI